MHAEGFVRTIFVRPPHKEESVKLLWKLLAPAYGLVDSGRFCYLTSNAAKCDSYGLTRSIYELT